MDRLLKYIMILLLASSAVKASCQESAEPVDTLSATGPELVDTLSATIHEFSQDDAESYYTQAMGLFFSGDRNGAIDMFDKAIALDPEYSDAYVGKATVLYNMGRYEQALEISDIALTKDENADCYLIQARINHAMKEDDRAGWAYSKAIRLNRHAVDAILEYTSILIDENNVDEASDVISTAIEDNPQSGKLVIRHSEICVLADNLDAAINDMTVQIRKEPWNPDYLLLRGHYWQMNGNYERALSDLYQSLNERPVASWYYIGQTRESMAEPDSAVFAYNQAISHIIEGTPDTTFNKSARQRLYILNKEDDAPYLRLLVPTQQDEDNWLIEADSDTVRIQIMVMDRSEIERIIVAGQPQHFPPNRRSTYIDVDVPVADSDQFIVSAMDVYGNSSERTVTVLHKSEQVSDEIVEDTLQNQEFF